MQAVIEQALESYRRQRLLEDLNDNFMALRKNEPEWNAELAERRQWDLTASDGSEKCVLFPSVVKSGSSTSIQYAEANRPECAPAW